MFTPGQTIYYTRTSFNDMNKKEERVYGIFSHFSVDEYTSEVRIWAAWGNSTQLTWMSVGRVFPLEPSLEDDPEYSDLFI